MTTRVNGIPALGLGTFGRTGAAGLAALEAAIAVGYRHFDTAQSYGTEENVGRAIASSGLKREAFFVTTKVAVANLPRARGLASVRESLATMKLDRVDLLLIHWPSAGDAIPIADYIEPLGEAKAMGLATLIGVSNFTIAHLQRAEAILGKGALATNQFECHPFLQNRKLRAHCAAAGIAVTCYLPIARNKVAENQTMREIAARHGATPAQVSLAFLLAEGLIVIPASSDRARMVENLAAPGLKLSAAEIEAVRGLDRGERTIDPAIAPKWD